MRIDEIRGGKQEDLALRVAGDLFDVRDEVRLSRRGEEPWITGADGGGPVTPAFPGAAQRLDELLDSGAPHLAWVSRLTPDHLMVHAHRFAGLVPLGDGLSIAVDEGVRDELRTQFGRGGTVREAAAWLEDELLIGPSPGADAMERRALISAGKKDGLQDAFRLYAARFAVDVRLEDGVYRIRRVVRGGRTNEAAVKLAIGPIRVVDSSAAAKAGEVKHLLDAAVRSSGSYLAIWQTYSQMEEAAILRRARAFGGLAYDRCELRDEAWRFRLAERPDDLDARLRLLGEDGRIELEVGEGLPSFDSLDGSARPGQELLSRAFGRLEGDWVRLAPEDEDDEPIRPPETGFLYISLRGDRTRVGRRNRAELAIREGLCPMPWLGLLLEGKAGPKTRYRKRATISPSAKRALGKSATPRQEEALRIAVNTPDIAMIQGPPGTGKTRVITALECWLADLADEGREVSHRVLVTSTQHDAVEEVARRTRVFELPAVKIGARKGAEVRDGVEEFRRECIDKLRDRLREPPVAERLAALRRLACACLYAPTPPADLAARLRELARTAADLLPPTMGDRIVARARALNTAGVGDDGERTVARAAAEGLRVEEGTFLDDGPLQAARALVRLRTLVSPEEHKILRACADWLPGDPMPPLDQLASTKERLLDLLQAPPPPAGAVLDDETQRLLIDVVDEADRRWRGSRDAENAVLATYLEDLEGDVDGLRAAIARYTVVLAATLQQAGGKKLARARGIETGSVTFPTVIVDEAARAHPLDLLIPLSLGERRIVLVGDQRQLPHMLEPEVERDLTSALARGELSEEARAALRDSLFARLWALLRKLEATDKHRRTVTLDTQFRMHPLLGEFVSRNFYERRGDPRIAPGRPAEDFVHALVTWRKKGVPAVAGWADVQGGPRSGEVRGVSKRRPVEAREVARRVREVVEQAPEFTIGIITFYADQVTEIERALVLEKLAEPDNRGGVRLREDLRERVRVGTVDAFQGKEFDVVFLSIVRSNELPAETDEDLRRKYGHLLLENRLCVAMSRQARLLVAVGDLRFVRESTTEWLEPLRDFVSLCEGDHGCVR